MKKDNKALIQIILPIVIAVFAVSAFAISGHITKENDKLSPTADTTVSAANAAQSPEASAGGTSKVRIIAVGDNLIHNTLIAAGENNNGQSDYSSFYENVKNTVEKADIACINQETILGGSSFEYSGYPMFNTPWEVGEAAVNAGFDVFTCASNHAMDMGAAGIEKELEFFSKYKNVVSIGTNASEEDYNTITYYEKNNITFAMLNYTYGTNGISLPGDKPWIVNLMDKDKITKDMTQARKNADVVIVFPHWGTEYSFDVSEYQEEYTKLFSDLGADIVIGAHPHVLEPVKWYTNETTGKKMIVYYSLGNFISHQVELDQLCGGMAEITVQKKNGEVTIESAKLSPVITFYKNTGDKYQFTSYLLKNYTDDIAKEHAKNGATPEYYEKLVSKIVDKEFLN